MQIELSWKRVLKDEFNANYFASLKAFLISEREQHTVYPPGKSIFAAFNYTPFDTVKVVIVGQDPYHGPGQANGLCFSVSPGVKIPPSLQNIFKEIASDIGAAPPTSGERLGQARGPAAQRHPHRSGCITGIAPGKGLGTIYRQGDSFAFGTKRGFGVYSVGKTCAT